MVASVAAGVRDRRVLDARGLDLEWRHPDATDLEHVVGAPGGHAVIPDDAYGGTYRLLSQLKLR